MLQHIPEERCPDCKSETRSRSQNNQHCNGHWNERREYFCGAIYTFSPNFMAVEHTTLCPRTEAAKAIRDKRDALVEKLKKVIDNSDADDKFKKNAKERLEYIPVHY